MYTLERSDTLTIGGEEIDVGPLTLDQTLAVSRVVYRRVKALKDDDETRETLSSLGIIREAKAKGINADGPPDDDDDEIVPPTGYQQIDRWINVVFALLEPDDVFAVASILLGRDAGWCRKHIRLIDVPKIVTAVRDNNDPGGLMLAFRQAAQGWRPLSMNTSSDRPS